MMFTVKQKLLSTTLILFIVGVVFGLGEYRRHVSIRYIKTLETSINNANIDRTGLESRINNLETDMEVLKIQSDSIVSDLKTELSQNKNSFEQEIGEINSTVNNLDKLSKTDSELLQKYSKTYFLNEHYEPIELTDISKDFTYIKNKTLSIHASVAPYLGDLLKKAQEDKLDLGLVSAYRSFGSQSVLKSTYKFTYGAGTANQFSAEQGYSEHQLGTAVDFANPDTAETLAGFNKTSEFKWLKENAQNYGFVLSYPENNPYYQYEPWHWRFVGVVLAKRLHDENIYFYDLDQREINSYLANIFD